MLAETKKERQCVKIALTHLQLPTEKSKLLRRSRGAALDSARFLFSVGMQVICSQRPTCTREYIKRLIASQVHGNLTPAGFSASSVEKYHCPLHLSSPNLSADRSLHMSFIARILHGRRALMNVAQVFTQYRECT